MSFDINFNINLNINTGSKPVEKGGIPRGPHVSKEYLDRCRQELVIRFAILQESYGKQYCIAMPRDDDDVYTLEARYKYYFDAICRDVNAKEREMYVNVFRAIMERIKQCP